MKTKNYKNKNRRVGFEIEFQGLTPEKTAVLIADNIGGDVDKVSDACFKIHTEHGVFQVEIDAKFLKELAASSERNTKVKKIDFEGVLKDILEPITQELVPTEIVSPPIEEDNFDVIRKIEEVLHSAGARGTNESSYFAFAMQFNPEITSKESAYLLSILRSYILLSTWLHSQIDIGLTRELTGYVDDFPNDYAELVLDHTYKPDLSKLIDDYLEYNPTRNRGLDFLPLFLFLDEDRVRNVVTDERIKPRPTFHYRLPSCQLGLESWNIFVEWKRWRLLEKVASDKKMISKMSKSFIDLYNDSSLNFEKKWLRLSNHYIEDFR
ncbi:putative amidoligase enzyme [Bacteriovorax sp. BAL6_X]|uniref:amidoligase family protein n=1 Tax=Bacteriovorax sp. BAL6_X TaxID=1201290 RepID=UPI00038682F1|nr:amidoligase family protein [Bacteriovorax sp. BAL6_X]EPZ49725.1 putative amidoligase enzyme [Bacteriovorax sp. BAL6_X]